MMEEFSLPEGTVYFKVRHRASHLDFLFNQANMFYRRMNEDILGRLLKYLPAAALINRGAVFHSSSQQVAQNPKLHFNHKNILNLQL